MKRMITLLMTLVLLLTSAVIPTQAAETLWLPDPGTVYGVDGSYYDSESIDDVLYDFYLYETVCTADELVDNTVAYLAQLEDLGFVVEEMESEDFILDFSFEKQDSFGEIAVMFGDESFGDENADYTWFVLLAVPEDMEFELGKVMNEENSTSEDDNDQKTDDNDDQSHDHDENETVCVVCAESGECAVCGGNGSVKFRDLSFDCVACMATGECIVCNGDGAIQY